ncbi:ABC transporter permease [Chloroflexus aggregans]|uniref:Inner-membrane translocator n=1 Tax=Chloroflexus aggregans (strain MD-66 / DSM 9485) TaxID=326427 RepID=B8G3J2_CHLAD|nr:ABC transporter permease [Chloroflexus aggregans]ACL23375.1 inner-membrane translocator [Chloroflexus aggregans DSM 9485]
MERGSFPVRQLTGATRFLLVLAAAFAFTTVALLSTGVSPLEVYRLVLFGAFSTPVRLSDMMMLAAPLLLCATGLTITFAGGLYNLGVEGQMIVGAIAAMVPLRLWPDWPPLLLWLLAGLSGMTGGALWAMLIGVLRRYAGVSEIFAGLGMNFLASGLALYMVLGPWRRQTSASLSGTELLPRELWLPTLDRLRLAPAAPVIAVIALGVVWWALTGTRWGLEVRAVGLNPAAAGRLGIATARRMGETLAACGALAGVAGMIQVVAVHHALIPNISSGIGLIGLLVALLARADPRWLLPISVAFATFTVGSIQLPLTLGIDSAIAGVLQGALVLFALAARVQK